MNVTMSLLDDIKTKQLKWRGHVQRMEEGRLPNKKLWNGAHQEEEKEEDLKLTGRKGLEDCWGGKGLMEDDWNDRDKWKKKIR